ncbi:MAG: ATP-binding protein [Actinomycetes bacterium]
MDERRSDVPVREAQQAGALAGFHWLEGVVDAVEADDLEGLVRPLLEVLHDLSGFESTYLTRIDWDAEVQHVTHALNEGELDLAEGLRVAWDDTLCKRSLAEGRGWTSDVPERWGDSGAATGLGIVTYVSVPVTTTGGGQPFGTLCAASVGRRPADPRVERVLRLFARLIGDAISRQLAVEEAEEQAEAARRRLAERSHFLAQVEHAMKAPITVISGWSATLVRGWDRLAPDARREALERIATSCERLKVQVEELVEEAQSSLVAADLVLVRQPLRPLVAEVVRDLLGSTERPTTLDVPEGLEARLDARALRIVLEHLLENALKYTPEGSPVEVRGEAADGGVLLSVVDHGPGLPAEGDLFAPFVRGTVDQPGSGLGLHIVRSLVEALGGSVRTAAGADGGAVFTLRLRP